MLRLKCASNNSIRVKFFLPRRGPFRKPTRSWLWTADRHLSSPGINTIQWLYSDVFTIWSQKFSLSRVFSWSDGRRWRTKQRRRALRMQLGESRDLIPREHRPSINLGRNQSSNQWQRWKYCSEGIYQPARSIHDELKGFRNGFQGAFQLSSELTLET